ncbi:GtrA family protein [Arcticibacter svalbardensis]|uniref:GtrA family protein n=1 Tax=Arcticibacter svalbardensis TaxID=1288027 RepID=UPI00058FAE5F|nr:GtrA family protein [Arcticibacter svalbardensis]
MINRSSLKIFIRAQFSAFTGGIADYLTMIFFTEVVGFHYTLSIFIGGTIGAVVNFTINRYWTFKVNNEDQKSINAQLFRFCLVVCGSICLKISGTYSLTELLRLDYRISRLVVDLIVSLLFNYVLQKHWVFVAASRKSR